MVIDSPVVIELIFDVQIENCDLDVASTGGVLFYPLSIVNSPQCTGFHVISSPCI